MRPEQWPALEPAICRSTPPHSQPATRSVPTAGPNAHHPAAESPAPRSPCSCEDIPPYSTACTIIKTAQAKPLRRHAAPHYASADSAAWLRNPERPPKPAPFDPRSATPVADTSTAPSAPCPAPKSPVPFPDWNEHNAAGAAKSRRLTPTG